MLISEKNIYNGRIINLNLEQVQLPNGVTCELEIIHHPGGVVVVALNPAHEVCLLRQYRHAAGGWLWELPAGKIDNKEDTIITARRELAEEAGKQAKDWNYLGKTISSPGVFTEILHLYLARELTDCEQRPEDEEVLEVHWLPLHKALTMIQDGEIYDAKTIIGLFHLQLFLQATA